MIRKLRKTSASTGLFVFVIFLVLGLIFGLWLGGMSARQFKGRNALRTSAHAHTVAEALDHAFGERYRALELLAPVADEATIARFRKIYPEILSVRKNPVQASDGFHLSVPTTDGGRLVATIDKKWPQSWLTPQRGVSVDLVILSRPPWLGQGPLLDGRLRNAKTGDVRGTVDLRWRDGKTYQTSIERLEYPTADDGGLAVVVATSAQRVSEMSGRMFRSWLLLGLILGIIPGAAAWLGIARSTRRLRLANEDLERRVSDRTVELEAAERSFRGIFENAPLGLYQCDADGNFLRVNPTLAQTLGYADPQSMIDALGTLRALGEPVRRHAFLEDLLSHGEAQMTTEVTTPSGRSVWLTESSRTIRDPEGRVLQLEGAVHDVTSQRTLEDQLRRIGATDPLTGLLNRRGLDEALSVASMPVSVVVLDLDRFKWFNDTHGHLAGDRALKAVAQALRSVLRDDAIVARIGGEEFVVCLPVMASTDARRVVDRLLTTVAAIDTLESPLTLSAGVATAMERSDIGIAFNLADQALYQAKEAGRNRIVFR